MTPKQSISSTSLNDAMAISSQEMPKNHTDRERKLELPEGIAEGNSYASFVLSKHSPCSITR